MIGKSFLAKIALVCTTAVWPTSPENQPLTRQKSQNGPPIREVRLAAIPNAGAVTRIGAGGALPSEIANEAALHQREPAGALCLPQQAR